MIDKFTFGNTRAAVVLTHLINENNNASCAKISKMFGEFNKILNELEKIDGRIAISVAQMLYEKTKTKVESYPHSSFIKNVLQTRYNIWVTERKKTMKFYNVKSNGRPSK